MPPLLLLRGVDEGRWGERTQSTVERASRPRALSSTGPALQCARSFLDGGPPSPQPSGARSPVSRDRMPPTATDGPLVGTRQRADRSRRNERCPGSYRTAPGEAACRRAQCPGRSSTDRCPSSRRRTAPPPDASPTRPDAGGEASEMIRSDQWLAPIGQRSGGVHCPRTEVPLPNR